MMTHDEIEAEAWRRHNLHVHQASHCPLSPDYHFMAIYGEDGLADFNDNIVNCTIVHTGGDDGIDSILWTTRGIFPADVKAFHDLPLLLVKEGKAKRGFIYILGKYHDVSRETRHVELLRWQHGSVVQAAPIGDFPSGRNHYIELDKLRPLSELDAVMLRPRDMPMDQVRGELRQWQERGLRGEPRNVWEAERVRRLWARVDAEVAHWQEREQDAKKVS